MIDYSDSFVVNGGGILLSLVGLDLWLELAVDV